MTKIYLLHFSEIIKQFAGIYKKINFWQANLFIDNIWYIDQDLFLVSKNVKIHFLLSFHANDSSDPSLVNPDNGTYLNDFGENYCIQRANSLYIYWVLREWLSVWIYVGYQPDWSQLDILPNHQNHLFWRPIEF